MPRLNWDHVLIKRANVYRATSHAALTADALVLRVLDAQGWVDVLHSQRALVRVRRVDVKKCAVIVNDNIPGGGDVIAHDRFGAD